ncbi:MAG: hypothetical protein MUF00_19465 [Gemmatimonadaceae bacterium]|nr:hypothetical protein [Gemmatimonadaceae bacterium]
MPSVAAPAPLPSALEICMAQGARRPGIVVPASAFWREVNTFLDDSTRRGFTLEPPEYLDRLLQMRWLIQYGSQSPKWVVRVPGDAAGTPARRFACDAYRDTLTSALYLGVADSTAGLLEPRAYRELTRHMPLLVRDSVLVFREPTIAAADAAHMIDSLAVLAGVLGLGPPPAAYILLFENLGSLQAHYHQRYPDGQFGAIAHLSGEFVAVAFIPRGPRGFSPHELAHLLVRPTKEEARRSRVEFPVHANEALAVALGGNSDRGYRAVAGETDRLHAAARITATLDSTLTLEVNSAPPLSNGVVVLAGVYSVAVRQCRRFPVALLLPPAALHPDYAATALAARLGVSRDSVVRLAAEEMVNDSSVVARVLAAAAPRHTCEARAGTGP